jgi:hypothetical protein
MAYQEPRVETEVESGYAQIKPSANLPFKYAKYNQTGGDTYFLQAVNPQTGEEIKGQAATRNSIDIIRSPNQPREFIYRNEQTQQEEKAQQPIGKVAQEITISQQQNPYQKAAGQTPNPFKSMTEIVQPVSSPSSPTGTAYVSESGKTLIPTTEGNVQELNLQQKATTQFEPVKAFGIIPIYPGQEVTSQLTTGETGYILKHPETFGGTLGQFGTIAAIEATGVLKNPELLKYGAIQAGTLIGEGYVIGSLDAAIRSISAVKYGVGAAKTITIGKALTGIEVGAGAITTGYSIQNIESNVKTMKESGVQESSQNLYRTTAYGQMGFGAALVGVGAATGARITSSYLNKQIMNPELKITYDTKGIVMKEGEPIEIGSETSGKVSFTKGQSRIQKLMNIKPKIQNFDIQQAAITKVGEDITTQTTKYSEGGKIKELKTVSHDFAKSTDIELNERPLRTTTGTAQLRSDSKLNLRAMREQPFQYEDESKILMGAKQGGRDILISKGGMKTNVILKGTTVIGIPKKVPSIDIPEPEGIKPQKPSVFEKEGLDFMYSGKPIETSNGLKLEMKPLEVKAQPIAKLKPQGFKSYTEANTKAITRQAKGLYDKVYTSTGDVAEASQITKNIRLTTLTGQQSRLATETSTRLNMRIMDVTASKVMPKQDIIPKISTQPKITTRLDINTFPVTQPKTSLRLQSLPLSAAKLESALKLDIITSSKLTTLAPTSFMPSGMMSGFPAKTRESTSPSWSKGKRLSLRLGKTKSRVSRKKYPGIISESISKFKFGKASVGKAAGGSTKEMEKAKLSIGEFYLKGGFMQKKKR